MSPEEKLDQLSRMTNGDIAYVFENWASEEEAKRLGDELGERRHAERLIR